jgi:hypothetical protein
MKILEIDCNIWDNFRYWNFVSKSTDFEMKLRFFPFPGGWILKEFVSTSINSSLHKLG